MRPLILSLLLVPLTAVGQDFPASPQFAEAMAVCDNMSMYVQSAQRQAAMGMPEASAKELTRGLMSKNLQLTDEVKAGAIALAMDIYSHVYATAKAPPEPIDVVLSKTCGKYRGFALPQEQVDRYLASTAQSAWNPLVRVPLCTKLAQTAANIGTARDRGMAREQMADIAKTALREDKFTSAELPRLIDDAYSNSTAEVAFFYLYNLGRCSAVRQQKEYPSLAVLEAEYVKCKTSAAKGGEGVKACHARVLNVNMQ